MSSTIEQFHDFFVALASVIGALLGLLFVAITVAQGRVESGGAPTRQRLRAAAAYAAFVNVFVLSTFALVPGLRLSQVCGAAGGAGLAFVLGGVLALRRSPRSWRLLRDVGYLVGLGLVFGFELAVGRRLHVHPDSPVALRQLATLLVVCSLVGIARAWDLVEGPGVGLAGQVGELGRDVVRRARHDRPPTDG